MLNRLRRASFLLVFNLIYPMLFMSIVVASSFAQDLRIANPVEAAPKPLYRDPVHDGAADPSLIWNHAQNKWMIFYTNRRADLSNADRNNVAWVHWTQIGIAESKDHGVHWSYVGVAKIPYGKPNYTFWAPDLVWDRGLYHIFVTVVPGIFYDWNAQREIIHLTSKDLIAWEFESKIPMSSDRTIDPYILKHDDGNWRLRYKDEVDHSYIHYVNSPDLHHWTAGRRSETAICGRLPIEQYFSVELPINAQRSMILAGPRCGWSVSPIVYLKSRHEFSL